MITYVLRRAAHTILALVLLVVVVFIFTHTIGDPARLMLPESATEDMVQSMRHRLGLDEPLPVQFGKYALGLLRLDLGTSLWQGVPNTALILSRLPATFIMAISAIILAATVGIGLGTLAALHPRSLADRIVITLSSLAVTSVDFWIALMLILLVSVQLHLLPTSGYGDIPHLILPAFVVALRPMGRIAQITRPAIIQELGNTHITAARAKGLRETTILVTHAGRNIGIVLLTLVGYEFASLIHGSAIIETVFGWPGLGFLLVQAINLRDWTLIVATTVVVAAIVIVVNFAIDMLYVYLDPRIRLSSH